MSCISGINILRTTYIVSLTSGVSVFKVEKKSGRLLNYSSLLNKIINQRQISSRGFQRLSLPSKMKKSRVRIPVIPSFVFLGLCGTQICLGEQQWTIVNSISDSNCRCYSRHRLSAGVKQYNCWNLVYSYWSRKYFSSLKISIEYQKHFCFTQQGQLHYLIQDYIS